MEIHIAVQDHKAHFLKELLEDLPFVNIKGSKETKKDQQKNQEAPYQQRKGNQLSFL